MTYQDTLDYLYAQLPIFQKDGATALKIGLDNIHAFAKALDNPHLNYPCIHIAGTNGKGSTTHILAAVLQSAGHRVGIYTSPHYVDFRERIKINGVYVSEDFIVDFVAKNKTTIETIKPSFFEVTAAMAFQYFSQEKVDVVVLETGLGGRLDATNICQPLLSIITNIGFDHQAILGDTLALIASEKAGIIKPNTPVLIGERHKETIPIFEKVANEKNAPLRFIEDEFETTLLHQDWAAAHYQIKQNDTIIFNDLTTDLLANYQAKNIQTAIAASLAAAEQFNITKTTIHRACSQVQSLTKMMGRWQILNTKPLTIADSAHNTHGFSEVVKNLAQLKAKTLHIVLGMVKDKNHDEVLALLPKDAIYYFTQPSLPRALAATQLQEKAMKHNLIGNVYQTVELAYDMAQQAAEEGDVIFVGGSIFVLAEVLYN